MIDNLNDATLVWRFMDFPKFVSLLDSSSLFFANVGLFEDKWEGIYTKNTRIIKDDDNTSPTEAVEMINKIKTRLDFRKAIYANCWHINDVESAAMWDLYARSGQGIAICSTIKRLKESIKWHKLDDNLTSFRISPVRYIDYNIDEFDSTFPEEIAPFFHKRKSFSHERELRLMANYSQKLPGINIPVILDQLIEFIIVTPSAPMWFFDLVKNVIMKYNLPEKKVFQSELDSSLLY